MLAIAGFEEVMAQSWYYKLDYKYYSDRDVQFTLFEIND